MYRFIVLSMGYVESSSTSIMVYGCEFFQHPGYATKREAITELALDFYGKYYNDYLNILENRCLRELKGCCRDSLFSNKEAKFCSACGCSLLYKKFSGEGFMEFVRKLNHSTCDSYGEAEWCAERPGNHLAWWPWVLDEFIGAPKEDIIVIPENAEVVLLCALQDAMPELKKIDDDECDGYGSDDWEKLKEE